MPVLVATPSFPPAQLDQLPQLVIGVQSLDPAVQLDTTTAFRKILSIGEQRDMEITAQGVRAVLRYRYSFHSR